MNSGLAPGQGRRRRKAPAAPRICIGAEGPERPRPLGFVGRNQARARGSLTVNVAPAPVADSTSSVPPWASAIDLAM